jgi:hypothetical protein
LQRKELEKFIEFKVDNRSERMGVIHDDAVTNVNRKTLARETSGLQSPNPRGIHHRGAEDTKGVNGMKVARDGLCFDSRVP